MRKVLLVLVILLAGGLIAADRLGVLVVQDRIGKEVAAQYKLSSQPDVSIHGFPFLTQAIGGEYDQIDVGLGDITQQGVTVRDVRIELHGVRAPLAEVANGNISNVVARSAVGSVLLPFDLIRKNAPREVTRITAAGDNLQVDLSGSIAGFPLSGTAVVALKASPEGVQITPQSVGTGGLQLPLNLMQQQLSWTVPTDRLPIGSRINDIKVTEDGIRVAASAENVPLGKLAQTRR